MCVGGLGVGGLCVCEISRPLVAAAIHTAIWLHMIQSHPME